MTEVPPQQPTTEVINGHDAEPLKKRVDGDVSTTHVEESATSSQTNEPQAADPLDDASSSTQTHTDEQQKQKRRLLNKKMKKVFRVMKEAKRRHNALLNQEVCIDDEDAVERLTSQIPKVSRALVKGWAKMAEKDLGKESAAQELKKSVKPIEFETGSTALDTALYAFVNRVNDVANKDNTVESTFRWGTYEELIDLLKTATGKETIDDQTVSSTIDLMATAIRDRTDHENRDALMDQIDLYKRAHQTLLAREGERQSDENNANVVASTSTPQTQTTVNQSVTEQQQSSSRAPYDTSTNQDTNVDWLDNDDPANHDAELMKRLNENQKIGARTLGLKQQMLVNLIASDADAQTEHATDDALLDAQDDKADYEEREVDPTEDSHSEDGDMVLDAEKSTDSNDGEEGEHDDGETSSGNETQDGDQVIELDSGDDRDEPEIEEDPTDGKQTAQPDPDDRQSSEMGPVLKRARVNPDDQGGVITLD